MLFTDEDRELVELWHAEQRLIHAACGQPLDLTAGKDNARKWTTEEVVCAACGAVEAANAAAADNDREGGTKVRGRFFLPVPRRDDDGG